MRPCCALLLASAAECVSVDRHGARGAQVRSCHLRPRMSFAEPATSRFALRDELLSLLPPGAPTALNAEHDALVDELERLKNTPATPAFLALGLSGLWRQVSSTSSLPAHVSCCHSPNPRLQLSHLSPQVSSCHSPLRTLITASMSWRAAYAV